jgi:hypothetical protein
MYTDVEDIPFWARICKEVDDMKLPDWAQVVMALAALVALAYAIKAIRSQRADAREQTAKHIWTEYHLKGLEHPRFSNPEDLSNKFNHAKKTLNRSEQKYLEYTWFVSFLLLVCDEILRLRRGAYWKKFLPFRRGTNWEQIVINNLVWHREYLKYGLEDNEYKVQSRALKEKIDQVVGPSGRTPKRKTPKRKTPKRKTPKRLAKKKSPRR